jgi:hypothetical protein
METSQEVRELRDNANPMSQDLVPSIPVDGILAFF